MRNRRRVTRRRSFIGHFFTAFFQSQPIPSRRSKIRCIGSFLPLDRGRVPPAACARKQTLRLSVQSQGSVPHRHSAISACRLRRVTAGIRGTIAYQSDWSADVARRPENHRVLPIESLIGLLVSPGLTMFFAEGTILDRRQRRCPQARGNISRFLDTHCCVQRQSIVIRCIGK